MNRRVGLEKVRFSGPIGYFEEERLLKSTFLVDISVEMTVDDTTIDYENLDHTVDYSILYEICANEFSKEVRLIETVAHRILNQIKDRFPFVEAISLCIKKLNPPIQGAYLQNSFVELTYKA